MRTSKLDTSFLDKLPDPVRTLPGFVDYDRDLNCPTTYESHTFFLHEERKGDGRLSAAYLSVRHGAGREGWRIALHLYNALEALVAAGKEREAFLLCWGLVEAIRTSAAAARHETRTEYAQAFVDGRLRKRKRRGQNIYKVWIEPDHRPEPTTAHEAIARRRATPRIE